MADLLRCKDFKMTNKLLDPLKPSYEQLDIAIPKLLDEKSTLDEVLPFYIAFTAKTSKDPEAFYPLIMKCLETVFGIDKTKRNIKDNEIADYAYSLEIKSKQIFDKIKDI